MNGLYKSARRFTTYIIKVRNLGENICKILTCMRKRRVEHWTTKAVSKYSNNFMEVTVESMLATNSDHGKSVSVPLILSLIV